MKIPPDQDKLMWSIADSGEASAAETFSSRFPELKHEMAKRMHMANSLRAAKQLHVPKGPIPAFKPADHQALKKTNFKSALAAALVMGAALALGIVYSVIRRPAPIPPKDVPVYTNVPLKTGKCEVVMTASLNPPEKTQTPKSAPATQSSSGQDNVAVPQPPVEQALQSGRASVHSMVMKQVPLSTALTTLADQCKIKISTAPGVTNPLVDLNYKDMDAIAILKDMGGKYGFGVVQEGTDEVMLVPQSSSSK